MENLAWVALAAIASGFGGYFGAYLRKKGENRAVHEDLARLTATTEEIRASIADRSWERQRNWELRKESVFSLMQSLQECQEALMDYWVETWPSSPEMARDPLIRERTRQRADAWYRSRDEFAKRLDRAQIVCGSEYLEVLTGIYQAMHKTALQLEKDDDAYKRFGDDVKPMVARAFELSRQELSVQSSEPRAV
jgi:hypothetical protein